MHVLRPAVCSSVIQASIFYCERHACARNSRTSHSNPTVAMVFSCKQWLSHGNIVHSMHSSLFAIVASFQVKQLQKLSIYPASLKLFQNTEPKKVLADLHLNSGPTPLPFIGNLHTILRHEPGYSAFEMWRRQYGPVCTFWLGSFHYYWRTVHTCYF